MEKKRNKHFFREKEFLNSEKKSWDLRCDIANQSYVKLKEPYQNGWQATWVVRKDILNRDDAWVYEKILELVNTSIISRRKDFKYKPYKCKYYVVQKPHLKSINVIQYNNLHPQVKKHFKLDYIDNNFYNRRYVCDITYEFEIKVSKNYITHYKEHDEILEQLYSEEEYKLDKLRYLGFYNYNRYKKPKWYRKIMHKGERKFIKNKTNNIRYINELIEEDLDIVYTKKECYW